MGSRRRSPPRRGFISSRPRASSSPGRSISPARCWPPTTPCRIELLSSAADFCDPPLACETPSRERRSDREKAPQGEGGEALFLGQARGAPWKAFVPPSSWGGRALRGRLEGASGVTRLFTPRRAP